MMRRAHTDKMKTSLRADKIIQKLIQEFEKNKDLLRQAGWIVSDANSFEWWDGLKTADEILISSILVQMTKWEIVKKIIERLRQTGLNKLDKLANLSEEEIEELIKGVNFYKTKAKRLKKLAIIVKEKGLENIVKNEKSLKEIEGIGDETAESLQLFVANLPVFPRSEYASRILSRILGEKISKKEAKILAESYLKYDVYKLKLFHAGIVTIGKIFCLSKPKCNSCIFKDLCAYYKHVVKS
ncbi:endonuclease-3 related protein [Sulfurisphaera ohwakuensis]|uniref:Endonuclease-3 related protein n=3 Tax=Sulfurisphaera ohwakuensis TaxID=69656 RepID=A0A7J9RP26_SULOH|nr:endonuclease-3 related protein [Sulfurisphaera ohwakuensis]